MVHVRLNERESNPNPHINFISALAIEDPASQEDARQFLRALAAQVRPIMKAHGFVVNSLEEYEYNKVFAGRNWNNGETIELVLRGRNGSFFPTSWLMGTLCHELAHIKHMNHGPAFQALWKLLREEVRALQNKGYYGDGYWSSGARLMDSAKVTGDGIVAGEFPEYMCGGAHSRTRPTALRRRRHAPRKQPGEPIASLKTGRQTAKKRKAGGRVRSKYAFAGEGASIVEATDAQGRGSGFGKQAGSKRAREERALAAERRIQALQAQSQQASTSKGSHVESLSEDESSDDEVVNETDVERREALLRSEPAGDIQKLGGGTTWTDFENEFIFTGQNPQDSPEEMIDVSSDNDIPMASGSTFVMPPPKQKFANLHKTKGSKSNNHDANVVRSSPGNLIKDEISLRKKESLGMAPLKFGGRTLGSATKSFEKEFKPAWACTFCTLLNKESFLACSACGNPRVQSGS
ncbi:WLM domain-containing protein [Mycena belliarum]|uniref:WLM domain-containing protein n=1 Tax=Mycena belliarum TaxID=1033014 RepID=A0AAD6UKJ2_9AGAR|nr:WLM domain-containing protein [Mycena belliae]